MYLNHSSQQGRGSRGTEGYEVLAVEVQIWCNDGVDGDLHEGGLEGDTRGFVLGKLETRSTKIIMSFPLQTNRWAGRLGSTTAPI